MGGTRAQKADYFVKLKTYLQDYKSLFIVGVDNVSSNQMHQIRKSLRGRGVVLMGKNTMIRRAVRGFIAEFPEYDRILPHIKGNVGFVFTNEDLKEIRELLLANKIAAPARAGALAPLDVFIPPGNTGMEPGKTSFFQALGIPTKIARGTIEITNEVHLIHKDTKVGASEATLLNLLNISPFTYGLSINQIYQEGNCFSPDVLDIEESALLKHFMAAAQTIACISLAANYPTLVSVKHSLLNAYKNTLAVSVATEYTFEGSEKVKEMLANPEAFAAAAAPAEVAAEAAPAEEKKEEADEAGDESDDDMGFGLFD